MIEARCLRGLDERSASASDVTPPGGLSRSWRRFVRDHNVEPDQAMVAAHHRMASADKRIAFVFRARPVDTGAGDGQILRRQDVIETQVPGPFLVGEIARVVRGVATMVAVGSPLSLGRGGGASRAW